MWLSVDALFADIRQQCEVPVGLQTRVDLCARVHQFYIHNAHRLSMPSLAALEREATKCNHPYLFRAICHHLYKYA